MSSFDTARDLRIPGVVIGAVFIDPKQLGPRMKNMAKAMLRKGVLTGGWSSKSKQVAKKVAENTEVMLIDVHSRGFHVPARHTYTDAVAEEVCTLIDADEALELMDDNNTHRNQSYLETVTDRTRTRHARARELIRGTQKGRWVWVFSAELSQQIGAVFTTMRTPAQIEAAEKLCNMLDNNTPIPITLSM